MAKRKHTQSRKKDGDSSDTPKKAANSGRRPRSRRNSDDEILEHHWEVVYDDSPGGSRGDQKRRSRPVREKEKKSGEVKEEKRPSKKRKRVAKTRKPAEGKQPAEEKLKDKDIVEKVEPSKAGGHQKKRRRVEKEKSAEKKQKGKQEKEQKPSPEPRVAESRPAESREPAEPAKPAAAKKKRPDRKRRKKQPAEAGREPPVVERPTATRQRRRDEDISPPEAEPVVEQRREEPRRPKKTAQPAEEKGCFWDMQLSEATLSALRAADYLEPTPVQAGFIPKAILGNDLMGQARTGTGKTAAFAIPILEQIDTTEKKRGPQALVLVPTRELAVQVRDECAKLAMSSRARVVAVYGGKPIRQQIEKLRRGAEVVVGTPGRVMDHMSRGTLFLGDLRIAVLDEADRMLDIGFRPDIEKILRQCPQSRQTLLLSATIPPPVKRLAQRYMRDPEMLDFSPSDVAVETIEQFYFTVDATRKFELLTKLLQREQPSQAIIFCRTRRGTERIYQRLSKKERGAACIHGDLPQSTRDRVMGDFRAGKVRLLLATDVVGRGIDVTSISHIINFDMPEFCDDYVHRVGRTGRMGREGVAFSFVTPEEGNELTRIEMRINRLLKRDEIVGLSIDARAAAEEKAATEAAKPEPKPVFGRRGRRVRRAL